MVSIDKENILCGKCIICGEILGSLDRLIRIPPFNTFKHPCGSEIKKMLMMVVHTDCWLVWDNRDWVASRYILSKAEEYSDSSASMWNEFCGFWGYIHPDINRSHGSLVLSRSSLRFENLFGEDIKCFDIRGRTPVLHEFLKASWNGELRPHNKFILKNSNIITEVCCGQMTESYLLVSFNSKSKKFGLNYNCNFFDEDIVTLRELAREWREWGR